ncbi:MAG: hypothetical protein ACJ795_21390 [Ktedonobacteraceae bacterium]
MAYLIDDSRPIFVQIAERIENDCTWISARIYRFGVLMYGQRPGLRQLARLVRMK